jgi:hypothetical protein
MRGRRSNPEKSDPDLLKAQRTELAGYNTARRVRKY